MTLNGIYPIVPTPFLDNGAVDYSSIRRLIDFMAAKKVHGLAVMGALGEGHKLTEAERTAIALGADAFVSKSNPPEQLLAAIASCECQTQTDSQAARDSKKRTVSPPKA